MAKAEINMSSESEAYDAGNRAAWRMLLQEACLNLGYDDPAAGQAAWILEREGTVAALREACAEFGDNEWEDDLFLADIIEKHLDRNLRG
jgi:hypothetical protein